MNGRLATHDETAIATYLWIWYLLKLGKTCLGNWWYHIPDHHRPMRSFQWRAVRAQRIGHGATRRLFGSLTHATDSSRRGEF